MYEEVASPVSRQDAKPDPRRSWRTVVTAFSVVAMCGMTSIAACQERESPQTVESLRAESPTLRDKVRWRIGVRQDLPLVSFYDPETGEYSGFEIEIAKALAAELGFPAERIDWVPVRTLPGREAVLQRDLADMVVSNFSITEEREPYVDFAGPYQVVPQALLVRRDRTIPLETVADLRAPDVEVCVPAGSTAEVALMGKGVVPEPVDSNSDCLDGLRSGEYDAFSTDLPILAGFASQNIDIFETLEVAIADHNEELGVAVPDGDEALRQLVAYFLDRWRRGPEWASPWLRAYDQTIGPFMSQAYRAQPQVDYPPAPELADYDSRASRR